MPHKNCRRGHNVTEGHILGFIKFKGEQICLWLLPQYSHFIFALKRNICTEQKYLHWREEWKWGWECFCENVCCAWLGLAGRELGFVGGSMLCRQMFNQRCSHWSSSSWWPSWWPSWSSPLWSSWWWQSRFYCKLWNLWIFARNRISFCVA